MTPSAGIVLAGGGLASQRCAETLRARGYEGCITMLCAENERPYDRPPLSKQALDGELDSGSLAFRDESWYVAHEVDLRLGAEAVGLNPADRVVRLRDGSAVPYEQLLIATGGRPRRLPLVQGFENVHELRSLADARRLRDALGDGGRLVVVGAGFIGQEVAATVRSMGIEVTIVEALSLPLGPLLGEHVGRWLLERHREQGVEVLTSARIERVRGNGRVEAVDLEDGRSIDCGAVLVGIGVVPAADWVRGSGLDPEGVRTDPAGRTSLERIFAAGDVSRPFDPRFGVHARTEHWEAAARQGAAAGRAMLGERPPSPPLPSFWSDQYGMRVQYVGNAEHADAIEVEPAVNGRDLAVTYSLGGRPVGALLVDRPREFVARRRDIELSHERVTQALEGALI